MNLYKKFLTILLALAIFSSSLTIFKIEAVYAKELEETRIEDIVPNTLIYFEEGEWYAVTNLHRPKEIKIIRLGSRFNYYSPRSVCLPGDLGYPNCGSIKPNPPHPDANEMINQFVKCVIEELKQEYFGIFIDKNLEAVLVAIVSVGGIKAAIAYLEKALPTVAGVTLSVQVIRKMYSCSIGKLS